MFLNNRSLPRPFLPSMNRLSKKQLTLGQGQLAYAATAKLNVIAKVEIRRGPFAVYFAVSPMIKGSNAELLIYCYVPLDGNNF